MYKMCMTHEFGINIIFNHLSFILVALSIASLDVISNPGTNSSTMAILSWRPKTLEDLMNEHHPFPVARATVTWHRSWPGGTKPHPERELRAQCLGVRKKGEIRNTFLKETWLMSRDVTRLQRSRLVAGLLPPLQRTYLISITYFGVSVVGAFPGNKVHCSDGRGHRVVHDCAPAVRVAGSVAANPACSHGAWRWWRGSPCPIGGQTYRQIDCTGFERLDSPNGGKTQRGPGWTLLALQSDLVAWPSSQPFSTCSCR